MISFLRSVMRKNRDLVWISLGAILFAGGPSTIASIFDAGHWYDIRAVRIESGPDFNKLQVFIDRSIYRPFIGDFDVAIWPIDLSAPACHGQGRGIAYKPSTANAISKTAEWLIGEQSPPKCVDALVPGEKYIANVTITVHPPEAFLWWMPLPTDTVWSNMFQITKEDDRG